MLYRVFIFLLLSGIVFFSCTEDSPVEPNAGKPSVSIISPSNNEVIFDTTTIVISATDNKKVSQVEVYIDSQATPSATFTSEPYLYTWDVSQLADSSLHFIAAKAYDEDGNVTISQVISVVIRRFAPYNLTSTFMDDDRIVLQWNDNCTFEEGFEIQFSEDGVQYIPIDTVEANVTTTNIHRTFAIFIPYYFRMRAISDTLVSKFSNVLSVTLQLLSPGILKVTSITDTTVQLKWEDRNIIEENFEIEQSEGGTSFNLIRTVPANTISTLITGQFERNANYFFRVRAAAGDTVSDYSTRARIYFSTSMYAGGEFTSVNDVSARRIAEWDGQFWEGLSGGVNSSVTCMVSYKGDLYAGGTFTVAGTTAVNNIARWNGFDWSAVGTGTNGPILSLAVYKNELYAGGNFSLAGGSAVNNIARWNGSTWSNAGNGVAGTINSLCVYDGDLYAGGNFVLSGTDTMKRLAAWNGTSWNSISSGLSGEVFSMSPVYSVLAIAGDFLFADTLRANRIITWNGSNFDTMGFGFDRKVLSLSPYQGSVAAGGEFGLSGNEYTRKVAYWGGTIWSELGLNGLAGDVYALNMYNNVMYAGENFTSNKSLVSNRIVMLDANVWKPVGSGLTGKVRTLYNYACWRWEVVF